MNYFRTVPVDESNVPSTNQPDSDNDDIETTKNTRHRLVIYTINLYY